MLMPKDKKIRKHSRFAKVIGVLAVLIALVLGINAVSPAPFSFVFKAVMDQKNDVVNLGPYESHVEDITQTETIPIPTDNYPDAGLTLYRKPGQDKQKVIFFIHGGGWIVGSAEQLSDFSKLMASYGYTVAALDYSKAPQHQYPTPVYQALAALEYLTNNQELLNIDMDHYLLAGNSAGAQISAQLGSILTQGNPNFRTPLNHNSLKGLLLINGVYNFDTVASMRFPGFKMFAWSYTGKKQYWNYERIDELSVMYAVNEDYPASFLTAGNTDPLEPQTYAFDAVLRKNNVNVESVYWTGSDESLFHDYIFDLRKPASQTTFQKMMTFAQTVLETSE